LKYAKNNDLQGLMRLLKIFNDKNLQLSNQQFLSIVNECKKIESQSKQIFMDSMKNNTDLKHGLFTTIHKSKGLEYDAVTFCKDVKLPTPPFEFKTNSAGQVLFDEVTKKPIVQDSVRFNKQRQDYIEEINMIYVAATRAKEQIYGKLSLQGYADPMQLENEDQLEDLENEEVLDEELMYYNKRYV
jgi:ATP-dependent exoDNAse (exonuclease V) beta subunit